MGKNAAPTSGGNNDSSSAGKGKDSATQEWTATRDVITKFDDRLDALRKYGFTLVTALFVVNGLIGKVLGNSGVELATDVKFVIFAATLLLIVALFLIDTIYRSYQRAASFRARVLETRLNLELTETISEMNAVDNTEIAIDAIYAFFLVGAWIIGFACLSSPYNWALIGVFAVLSLAGIYIRQNFRTKNYWPDWTMDRVECVQSEQIRITLTNLGRKPLYFKSGDKAWEVKIESLHTHTSHDGNSKHIDHGTFGNPGPLRPGGTCDWLWDTKDMAPGIYRMIPNIGALNMEKGILKKTAGRGIPNKGGEEAALSTKVVITKAKDSD